MTEPLVTTRDGVVVSAIVVPASDARAEWQRGVNEFPETGRWPVILGSSASLPGYDERKRWIDDAAANYAPPAADVIRAADALSGRDYLVAEEAESRASEAEDADDPEFWDYFDATPPSEAVASIPRKVVPSRGDATIALIPTASPAEIAAVIGFGNWNGCPHPHQHVAAMRYWLDAYGAELQAMSPDTLEFHVRTPPLEFGAALRLAIEHFVYAPDLLMQGVHGTVGELAQALVGSDRWYMWWD